MLNDSIDTLKGVVADLEDLDGVGIDPDDEDALIEALTGHGLTASRLYDLIQNAGESLVDMALEMEGSEVYRAIVQDSYMAEDMFNDIINQYGDGMISGEIRERIAEEARDGFLYEMEGQSEVIDRLRRELANLHKTVEVIATLLPAEFLALAQQNQADQARANTVGFEQAGGA